MSPEISFEEIENKINATAVKLAKEYIKQHQDQTLEF